MLPSFDASQAVWLQFEPLVARTGEIMNSPIRDGQLSDHSKYIPKNHREQNHPKTGGGQPYLPSAPTAPASRNIYQGNRPQYQEQQSEEYLHWAEPAPPPPLKDGWISLVGRIATVIGIAGFIALLVIFAKPLSQTVRAFLNDDTQTSEAPARREAMLRTTAAPKTPDREQPAARTAAASIPVRSAASGAVVAAAIDAVPPAPQPQATVAPPPPLVAVTADWPGARRD